MAKEDTPFLFRWFFPNGGDRRNAQVILMNAEGEPYTAYKFETKFDPNVPIEAQTPRTHIYALSPPRASYSPTNSHSTLVPPPNDYLSSDSSPTQKPSKLTFTQSKKEIATVKWEKDFYATFVKFNHWPGEDIVAYVQQDANGVAGANGTFLVKRIQKTFLLRHAVMKEESALVKAASADKCLRFLVDGWRECKWKFSKSTGDLVAIKPFEMLASTAEMCRYSPLTQVLSFSPKYMGLSTHDCMITLWLHLVRLEKGYEW
ncbi:uncharacterized protein EI90DRAFT_2477299 [Cantharellus anzutake]|uniref:uncharacterized protein n=1 Tax=Cantharellus anzutake TaxID=1750568 RepID=UPI0019071A6A|nr:uncharacterized protein EI90DRAFT_2477299 [Cantharellus anzutake]KAF8322813.1 hypothetical protein EI90DRAFT_2477299 [Cantharellus anzutake]